MGCRQIVGLWRSRRSLTGEEPRICSPVFTGPRFLTNDGANWTPVDSGLPANCSVMSLATSQSGGSATSVFAGTSRYGVFLSTNNGTTWTQVSTGLPFSSSVPYYGYYDVTTLLHAGQNLFAGIWGAESTVPLTTEQLGH